jgi:hypothetical protein
VSLNSSAYYYSSFIEANIYAKLCAYVPIPCLTYWRQVKNIFEIDKPILSNELVFTQTPTGLKAAVWVTTNTFII